MDILNLGISQGLAIGLGIGFAIGYGLGWLLLSRLTTSGREHED